MSNSLTIKGKITQILDVETGTSKAGKEWKKQNFVIDTGDQYNPEVCFQLFGDAKIDKLAEYNKVGDDVTVHFNVSSREFNEKWYHNLDAWKVMSENSDTATASTPSTPAVDDTPAEDDDLPF